LQELFISIITPFSLRSQIDFKSSSKINKTKEKIYKCRQENDQLPEHQAQIQWWRH